MKKVKINDGLYNVVSSEELENIPSTILNPRITAVETRQGGLVMPLRSQVDSAPGFYYVPGQLCHKIIPPSPEEAGIYSKENIVDYTQAKTIHDIAKNNKLVRELEEEILTTNNQVTMFYISDNDMPEMRAMKMAINNKQIDINLYQDRFPQFQNDMRILKKEHTITLQKMLSNAEGLDLDIELIIKDKPDCVNPMGTDVNVKLTEGRGEDK